MIRGQDIVTAAAIASEPTSSWSYRDLHTRVGVPVANVQRALIRLEDARLYSADRRTIDLGRFEEFLIHAAKYLFPAHLGRETRGFRTAWAAGYMASKITQDGRPPVWPSSIGTSRGPAVTPLHASVPALVGREDAIVALLMSLDAIRLDEPRLRNHAVAAVQADLERLSR